MNLYAVIVMETIYRTWDAFNNSPCASERRLALFAKTLGLVTHDRIITGLPRERRP